MAAFDLDGTLTRRDTFLPFLAALAGRKRVGLALLAVVPKSHHLLGAGAREFLKSSLVRQIIRNERTGDVEEVARRFAYRLVSRGLRSDAVRQVDLHRQQGCELVVVSASLEIYVREVAQLLRFDAAIATQLELQEGRATGNIVGPWVTRGVKAQLLRAYLGTTRELRWAYGNDSKDTEMLALSTNPRWI